MVQHKIGTVGLTAIGVGTMIGSGWLFSAYYAAKIAGPGAYLAWLTTSIMVLLLGLCLAEFATIYPKRGLMARVLTLSHNKEFAFICTISTWLGLTAVVATEAEGSVQYISSISSSFGPHIFDLVHHQLTPIGLALAIAIIICFAVINFWGVKILSNSNVILTACKIFIPILTAVTIMFSAFHGQNFTHYHHSLVPYHPASIFIAMIGAGMVYSFNGFQNIVSFSAEVENPSKQIPLAIFGSIIITLLVYLVLQTAFIGAITPASIAQGWHQLDFTSPFVQLTAMLNLNLIMVVLYADSVISPSGTGLIYTGSTTRLLTAMSQDGLMPKFFNKLSVYNFSRRSLVFTIILAIVFLLLFRSWATLVSFLSLFYVISYMSIPLSLGKLQANGVRGNFKVPFAPLLLPLIFAFLSCLFVFAKFPFTGYVSLFCLLAYGLYLLAQWALKQNLKAVIKHSAPMMVYIALLTLVSALGPVSYGGEGLLSNTVFFAIVIGLSLIMYGISCYHGFIQYQRDELSSVAA